MAPLRISNLWLAPMNDVTTIDINHIYRDSKFSQIELFSWKIVVICNDCKLQKSLFCIDISKYRLITNLGILCLWSLKEPLSGKGGKAIKGEKGGKKGREKREVWMGKKFSQILDWVYTLALLSCKMFTIHCFILYIIIHTIISFIMCLSWTCESPI